MHMTGDALQLKEKGNECFQSGRISEYVFIFAHKIASLSFNQHFDRAVALYKKVSTSKNEYFAKLTQNTARLSPLLPKNPCTPRT